MENSNFWWVVWSGEVFFLFFLFFFDKTNIISEKKSDFENFTFKYLNFIFLFHIRVYPDNKIWANVAKIKTDISQISNFKSELEKDINWGIIARFLGFLYISRYLSNLRFISEKASFLKLILILINTNQKIVGNTLFFVLVILMDRIYSDFSRGSVLKKKMDIPFFLRLTLAFKIDIFLAFKRK